MYKSWEKQHITILTSIINLITASIFPGSAFPLSFLMSLCHYLFYFDNPLVTLSLTLSLFHSLRHSAPHYLVLLDAFLSPVSLLARQFRGLSRSPLIVPPPERGLLVCYDPVEGVVSDRILDAVDPAIPVLLRSCRQSKLNGV